MKEKENLEGNLVEFSDVQIEIKYDDEIIFYSKRKNFHYEFETSAVRRN